MTQMLIVAVTAVCFLSAGITAGFVFRTIGAPVACDESKPHVLHYWVGRIATSGLILMLSIATLIALLMEV